MATQTCNELDIGDFATLKKLIIFWEKSPVYITNKRRREHLDEGNRMVETIREYEWTTSQVRD